MSKVKETKLEVTHKKHKILVTNVYERQVIYAGIKQWMLVSTNLYVDGMHLDKSDEAGVGQLQIEPILKYGYFSEHIDSIEVYYSGITSLNHSIKVNGVTIHQDSLNFIDRLFEKAKSISPWLGCLLSLIFIAIFFSVIWFVIGLLDDLITF